MLSAAHAVLAAYFARMAQQWLSVSSGRASVLSLAASPHDVLGVGTLAAIAGAVMGPWLHAILARVDAESRIPRLAAALCGVGYALAVLLLTIVIATPWVMVMGRGPGESIASALRNAVFVVVFGTPLFMVTGGLVFAPVLVGGGAIIGLGALIVERRLPAPLTTKPS
jgi:hypothetical protein